MPELSHTTGYYAYILRCWVEAGTGEGGAVICRYSLEDPHTGERVSFAGLAPLTEFLQARAADCGAPGAQGPVRAS